MFKILLIVNRRANLPINLGLNKTHLKRTMFSFIFFFVLFALDNITIHLAPIEVNSGRRNLVDPRVDRRTVGWKHGTYCDNQSIPFQRMLQSTQRDF